MPNAGRTTRAIALLVAAAMTATVAVPAHAQQRNPASGLPVIRDAEIENLLRDYTQPVLRAAGLAKQNIHIVIINERAFNAFVVDGRRIFINTGALMDSKTPNEIIGVLAHEAGHIAGGHLARMREQLANAQTASIVALLLGAGAIAAGARSGNGVGQGGAAALLAPQSAIQNSLLAYQRSQEEQADKAGVKFLNATGQSAKGMYDTFKRFEADTLFSARDANPYLQNHPLPAQRVEALAALAKSSPHWNKTDPPQLQFRHDMMRAKLVGFIDRPDTVLRRYPPSDTSLPARYARAISTYRHGDFRTAMAQIDALIKAMPSNPYIYELKGQALVENGHPTEAIAPLRHAVQATNAPLIQMLLAQALIAANNGKQAAEAIPILRAALTREPDATDGYTQLAIAYGQKGSYAEADLASAQAAFARGDVKTARELASRAKSRFPIGSPGWVKSDDIVAVKPTGSGLRPN